MATKEYSNNGVTIVWNSDKCIHSAKCVKNAPKVFKPKDRPWVQMEKDSSDRIKHAVRQCPSGALKLKEDIINEKQEMMPNELNKATVIPNGPLKVSGPITVDCNGKTEEKANVFF